MKWDRYSEDMEHLKRRVKLVKEQRLTHDQIDNVFFQETQFVNINMSKEDNGYTVIITMKTYDSAKQLYREVLKKVGLLGK